MAKLIRVGGHVRTFEWELFWEYTKSWSDFDVQCNLSLSLKATCNFTLPIYPFIKYQWNFP